MTFTPKVGKAIVGQDADRFREIRSITGKEIPLEQKQNPFIKAANSITDFIGARGIAKQFGSSIAEAKFRLQGNDEAADIVLQNAPSFKEVAGSAIQTGSMLTPTGAGKGILAKVGLGALAGQMVNTGADLQAGKSVGESLLPSVEAGIGAAIPLTGEGYKAFGKLLGKTGEKIQFSTIKPTQADIKDGFKVETIKKYNLGGSLNKTFQNTENKLSELSKQLDDKLVSATETIDMEKVLRETAEELTGDKLSSFGVNNQLGRQIESLGDEVARITKDGTQLSVKEANTVKRAAGHMGAWQFGVKDPDATAREKIYSTFYSKLKKEIEDNSPEGVQELNKQMSEIIPVMNSLIRRIPVAERNNLIGLGEIVSLSQIGYDPRVGFLTLASLASKSSATGNVLQKTGENIANTETARLGTFAKFINQSMNQPETQSGE